MTRYRPQEEKTYMIRKLTTILSSGILVLVILAAMAAATEVQGTVAAVDAKGMATIKTTDGKELKVQMAGVKAGDKVDCHVEGGKASCHKLGEKH
jgi:hypothetical protein